jgi:prophage regulatory protein
MHGSNEPTALPGADAAIFLRMNAVTRMTGLARSTIYRLVAQDKFPMPVRLASRAIAWRRTDLDRWSEARPTASH